MRSAVPTVHPSRRQRRGRVRLWLAIAFATMLLVPTVGLATSISAAPPTGTDASEVSHWNQVAATTDRKSVV